MPWYKFVGPDGKYNVMHMSTSNAQKGEEELAFDAFSDGFRESGRLLTEISETLAEYLTFYRHLLEYGDSQAALATARRQIASVRAG